MSLSCKNCHSSEFVKNGFVREKQRYKCKGCGFNFIEGDTRTNPSVAAKKALCVLFYALGKASFNMLGKLLDHSPSLIYRWVKEAGLALPEPSIAGDIKEIEFDEMWHFVRSKTKNGSSKRWIVVQGEPSPGLSVVVMLQPSEGSTTKLGTWTIARFTPMTGRHFHPYCLKIVMLLKNSAPWSLSAITAILAIILGAWPGAQKWSPSRSLWSICLLEFGAPSLTPASFINFRNNL